MCGKYTTRSVACGMNGTVDSKAGRVYRVRVQAEAEFGRVEIVPSFRWTFRERVSTVVRDLRGMLRIIWKQ